MIGNENANKIIKSFRNSPQTYSETLTNKHDKEIRNDRYISPEETQKIIDNLRSINFSIKKEYQKIIKLLDNTPNQPSKFKIKNLVETNDESRGTYDIGNQIRFKVSILRPSLCD